LAGPPVPSSTSVNVSVARVSVIAAAARSVTPDAKPVAVAKLGWVRIGPLRARSVDSQAPTSAAVVSRTVGVRKRATRCANLKRKVIAVALLPQVDRRQQHGPPAVVLSSLAARRTWRSLALVP